MALLAIAGQSCGRGWLGAAIPALERLVLPRSAPKPPVAAARHPRTIHDSYAGRECGQLSPHGAHIPPAYVSPRSTALSVSAPALRAALYQHRHATRLATPSAALPCFDDATASARTYALAECRRRWLSSTSGPNRDALTRRLKAASTRRKRAAAATVGGRGSGLGLDSGRGEVAAGEEGTVAAEPITLPPMRWEGEPDQQLAHMVGHRALIICREIEWATVIVGFEQANKYTVRDERGDVVAYIAEETPSMGNAIGRQLLGTHRRFTATVMDVNGNIMFRVQRPVYLINSQMNIEGATGEKMGEVVQRWHLWQRNYDLYMGKRQFASITGSFLAWEFELKDENGGTLALIDRNFQGFGKELFTDAGKYVIHFGMPPDTAAEQATVSRQALIAQNAAKEGQPPPEVTSLAKLRTDCVVIPTQNGNQLEVARHLTLSERSIALACAITIDFDYFSQHSGSPGFLGHTPLLMPIPLPSGGDASSAGDPSAAESAAGTAATTPPPTSGSETEGGGGGGGGEHLGGDEFPGREEFAHDTRGEELGDDGGGDDDEGGGLFGTLMDIFGDDD